MPQFNSVQRRRWLLASNRGPTDSACAVLGWKVNGENAKFERLHPRLHEHFFDTERKRMSVVHTYEEISGYS